jgi:hypothetical protein
MGGFPANDLDPGAGKTASSVVRFATPGKLLAEPMPDLR